MIGVLRNCAVSFSDGRIAWVGPDSDAPPADVEVDAHGWVGFPGLIDCHTHAVWAGSRASEFERRLRGESYTSILEAGGGILSTVRATREASDDTLIDLCSRRLGAFRRGGVCTVEVKGGYGLDADTECRMLRAARAAGQRAGVRVLTTFLGAHAIPAEFRHRRDAYVRDVIDVQLPRAAGLADFIDVYIDRGAFSVDEGRAILQAGIAHGLKARVHAEQVAFTGAAKMAAELGAVSADHLERIDASGIAAMAKHGTVAVLLPGAMLYLGDAPPPVAALRGAGIPLAVATDLNPGSSPVGDLWACATLACLTMGLSVDEALHGITRNAALALGRPDLGRVSVGATGDLALFPPIAGEPPEPAAFIQHFGGHAAALLVRDGQLI